VTVWVTGLINATLGLSWLGDMYLRIWSEASEYAGFPLTDVNDPWQVRAHHHCTLPRCSA
jgi:hypothetical protein